MPPKVVVCLLTYNRLEYAKKTLISTLTNLRNIGNLHVHIASDGDSEEYIRTLAEIAGGGYGVVDNFTVSNSERGGYGRNVNLATQVFHSFADFVLMLEDDWELTRELDLGSLVADMQAAPEIDCVRLGYLSHTQSLYGEVRTVRNNHYLLLDPDSLEPHVFAGHPRIESVKRQREVGEWPEGELPGTTEFMVAHILRSRRGVAWPIGLFSTTGPFAHIGSIRSY